MTLYQFNALNDNEKADAIWEGAMIGDRQEAEHNVLLYQLDSFYVEVYYDKQLNNITRFRSFVATKLLAPYLLQIDLSDLLNK